MPPMPPMNVRSTLERIAHVATGYLKPAYSRDDMQAWLRNHAIKVRQLEDLLDVELLDVFSARKADWGDFPGMDEHHHGGMLVMRLPDGTLGGYDQHNETPKEMRRVAHERVCALLLGRIESRAVPDVRPLPPLPRAVLENEEIDVGSAERLGVLLGRMAFTINGRHHGADTALTDEATEEFLRRQGAGDYTLPETTDYTWAKIKIMVSKDPQVHVLDNKVTARVALPAVIAQSLAGRSLTDVFDHPTFRGMTIAKAIQRPSGFTLTLGQ